MIKKVKTMIRFIVEGERCVRWDLEKICFGFLTKNSNSIISVKRGIKTNAKLYALWKMSLGMLAEIFASGT